MCRILGLTQFDYAQHRHLVERFYALVRSGAVMTGDPPGHEDGWGLAFYQDGRLVVHKSGANLLEETDRINAILREAGRSPLLILHLRKSAWANTSSTRHAHPFQQGEKVFFHNGVVYDYQELLPQITVPGLADDARDTEVFFYHVLSGAAQGLGEGFLASVARIRERHRYSALNCLFSDGRTLFAYRDYAKEGDYYSLYKACTGDSWLISSEPLDERLPWQMMAQEEFLAIPLAPELKGDRAIHD